MIGGARIASDRSRGVVRRGASGMLRLAPPPRPMLLPTAPPIAGRYPPPMPASVHLHRVADLFARTVRTCEIVVEGGRIAAMRETAS